MGRDVNQHMESPGGQLPERPLKKEPKQNKYQGKDDEAVCHVVEMMDIQRDGRFRRRAVAEIGFFRKAECGSHPQNPE